MMFDGCQTGDPCVLPFRYKNVTYDGCTTVEDPEDKLWCSTKVGQHTPLCHSTVFRWTARASTSGSPRRGATALPTAQVRRLVMTGQLSNSCARQRRQCGPCPSAGSWRLDLCVVADL